MEPSVYKSFRMPWAVLPPHIPIPGAEDEITPMNEPNGSKSHSSSSAPALPDMMQEDMHMSSTGNKLNAPAYMSSTHQQPFMSSWDRRDDEPTPKASGNDYVSNYPHSDLSLPHPSLTLDFRMAVTLNPKIAVGPTPFGFRNWISFSGGSWSGCWGSGIVLPGGQDSQLVQPDGTAHLETNYILQTYDYPPAHIVIKTNGWRTGPPGVLAKLADPQQADGVDPNTYSFRLFVEMETGDERYREQVNHGMWVGSGMRKGAEVIYDAYRIS